jgi:hypothetical protein
VKCKKGKGKIRAEMREQGAKHGNRQYAIGQWLSALYSLLSAHCSLLIAVPFLTFRE